MKRRENKEHEITDAENLTSIGRRAKAIVCTEYGPPDYLQLEGEEQPTRALHPTAILLHLIAAGELDR